VTPIEIYTYILVLEFAMNTANCSIELASLLLYNKPLDNEYNCIKFTSC